MPSLPKGEDQGAGSIGSPLYLITDRTQTGGRSLVSVVREALEGGVRAVQLREKDLSGDELFVLATELRSITSAYGAKLLINERIDIAMAVVADGVHIGASSIPVSEARRILGPEPLIGYSAHAVDEALQAEADGADFVTFGPVYHTPSKAAYGDPVGVDAMRSACLALSIPLFALGGIKPENIAAVMAAGARGIALVSAIIASPDPRAATVSLLQKINHHAIHP
jgi:thiamine-phosphate pyrophosphorylase